MELPPLDDFVMLINDNPGTSAEELMPLIEKIGPFDSIHVLRQFASETIIHFSIAIVKFKSPETAEKAIHFGATIPDITIMKADPFYLYPAMGFIIGLKRIENTEYYTKLFMPLGVHSLRVLETNLDTDPYILICAFIDKVQRRNFKKAIDGTVVAGQKLFLSPLRRTTAASYTSPFPSMPMVLSNESKHDFTLFHFEKTYKCWSGAAFAMSSVIHDAMKSNPSLREFTVPNIRGPFKLFEMYFNGQEVDIIGRNAAFLLKMGEALGIKSLVNNVNSFIYSATDPVTRVALLVGFNNIGTIPDNLIDGVAASFEAVKNLSDFNYLPYEVLIKIISSPKFNPASEESLFHWVVNFVSSSPNKFKNLVNEVVIEKLDAGCLLEFLNLPETLVDLNDYRLSLSLLGARAKFQGEASLKAEQKDLDPDKYHTMHRLFVFAQFLYQEGKYFDGICHYYRTQQPYTPKGDPSITVSASSVFHGDPNILVKDRHEGEWFGTNEISQSFIIVKFNWEKAAITGYSIQTHNQPGKGHINNWTLSGSNDAVTWTVLDKISNNSTLNGPGKVNYFPLKEQSAPFKMFKICQDRANPLGFFSLNLSHVEFFGLIQ